MSFPLQLIAVALGGGVGAALRFMVNEWFRARAMSHLPLATLSVNVLGCLLAGLLLVWLEQRGTQSTFWRPLLMVGFLGGLTTFSAMGVELLHYLRLGRYEMVALIAAANCLAGLLAVVAGARLGRLWFAS